MSRGRKRQRRSSSDLSHFLFNSSSHNFCTVSVGTEDIGRALEASESVDEGIVEPASNRIEGRERLGWWRERKEIMEESDMNQISVQTPPS